MSHFVQEAFHSRDVLEAAVMKTGLVEEKILSTSNQMIRDVIQPSVFADGPSLLILFGKAHLHSLLSKGLFAKETRDEVERVLIQLKPINRLLEKSGFSFPGTPLS